MNKKGFTLVELIGVIILFGAVLIAIASPMLAQISKQQKRLEDSQIEVLKAAAEEYVDANVSNYPKISGSVYYVSLMELYFSGILDESMGMRKEKIPLDRMANKPLPPTIYPLPKGRISNYWLTSYIKISVTGNRYKYEYIEDLDKEGIKSAEEIKEGDYVYYSGITWKVFVEKEEEEDPYTSPYTSPYNSPYTEHSIGFKAANPDEEYSVSRLKILPDDTKPTLPYIYLEASEPVTSLYYSDGEVDEYWFTYFASKMSFNNILFPYVDIFPSENHEYVSDGVDYVYPVIPIYSLTAVTGGSGTASNPYTLVEKLTEANNVSIKQKNVSIGSYISIANKLYRIISTDSNDIRVLLTSNTDVTGVLDEDSYVQFSLLHGAGKTLEKLSVPDVFKRTNFYTGYTYYGYYDNFMTTAQAKSRVVFDVKLALPKVTELFTVPFIGQTSCYMTITTPDDEGIYEICPDNVNVIGAGEESHLNYVGVISKDNILVSGNGTYLNPYVLKIS